ncbi:MAG: phosphoenolpyruvate--protein phosphotransferase [Thermoanaerobaculia bacterium]
MASEIEFAFSVPGGLHARPASLLRAAVSRFTSATTFVNRRSGRTANAKSTLALVSTLTRHGDSCALWIEGVDEETAAEALRRFLRDDLPLSGEAPDASPRPPDAPAALPRALSAAGVPVLRGIRASGGIARGRAVTGETARHFPESDPEKAGDAAGEIAKLDRAFAVTAEALRTRSARAANETERAILAAHLSILEDPELHSRIEDEIRSNEVAAARAVRATVGHFVGILRASGSASLEERALDLRDLAEQLVRAISGRPPEAPAALSGDAALVAEDLAPSAFLSLDRRHLRGIALGGGGRTSHTVILARAAGIPCVTGLGAAIAEVPAGSETIVDGERGLLVVTPPPAVLRFYEAEMEKLAAIRSRLEAFRTAPGRTADGRRVEVGANVASLEDIRLALASGAEGIGLFRTEFLFMSRREPPSEEEQRHVYSEAARMAGGMPVIVRTLDAGGDKRIGYLGLPAERNPFLGYRAVRMYGEHREIVSTQLRAILRASAFGKLKIMVPMVASVEEMREVRALVRSLSDALARDGVLHDAAIEIGMMVEIPSAAFHLEALSKEADFFSIGSNDLAQYFFAADRDNERVSHLYSPLHPAFLRLLKKIVDEAHRAGRWIGLCGEMGRDPLSAPVLVGLGLDEISLAAPGIPALKSALIRSGFEECRTLLDEALGKESASEVRALVRGFTESKKDRAIVADGMVRLRARSRGRDEAIRELVNLLHASGRVTDADRFEEAVWRREETASTAVGFGVAIPHAKSAEVQVASIAFLRFDPPLVWAAGDEDPVRMAILIAVPEEAFGDAHLRLIATLSRRLMDDQFRDALLSTPDEAAVARLICEAAP